MSHRIKVQKEQAPSALTPTSACPAGGQCCIRKMSELIGLLAQSRRMCKIDTYQPGRGKSLGAGL